MSSSLADLTRRVDALAKDLGDDGLKQIVNKVSLEAKKDLLAQTSKDIGSDYKMSGWKVKFGAGYNMTSNTTAQVGVRPIGPWLVLNFGRRAKPAGLPKRRKRKIYNTPLGPRTATKQSPFPIGSTRGKGTFVKAARDIRRETPARINKHKQAIIGKYF